MISFLFLSAYLVCFSQTCSAVPTWFRTKFHFYTVSINYGSFFTGRTVILFPELFRPTNFISLKPMNGNPSGTSLFICCFVKHTKKYTANSVHFILYAGICKVNLFFRFYYLILFQLAPANESLQSALIPSSFSFLCSLQF